MGPWAFYFLAKTWLHYRGHIRLDVLPNLALALLLVLPLPRRLAASRLARGARLAAALAVAALLLWHETWFPSVGRTTRLLSETGGISPAYLARFVGGSVDPWDAGALALILAACLLLARRITLTPLAFAAVLSVAVTGTRTGAAEAGPYVERFFEAESARAVRLGERPLGPDLDLVLLHVCSLSWSDLRAAGLDAEALFRRFDLVFTRFNSVSSYTNPSAIRLLRATCGQPRHRDLYREARKECYLLDALRAQGYATWTAIDNDAPSYRFAEEIAALGGADPPIEMKDLPVRQVDFDGTPIHDDLSILERWLRERRASPARRAALYMDVTTLHGGARWAGEAQWWKRGRADLYREFAERLFSNLDRFFETLRASGGRFAVVLVPEHGMALRGSTLQPPDIREIPLPAITTVPVGLKLIGEGAPVLPERQRLVSRPTSYLALAHLIESLVTAPRFGPEAMLAPEVVDAIPETPFVAENEASMVVGLHQKLFLLGKRGSWIEIPAAALGE